MSDIIANTSSNSLPDSSFFDYSKDVVYKKNDMQNGGFSVKSIIQRGTQKGGAKGELTKEEKEEIDYLKSMAVPYGLVHISVTKTSGAQISRAQTSGAQISGEDNYISERINSILLELVDESKPITTDKKKKSNTTRKISNPKGKISRRVRKYK